MSHAIVLLTCDGWLCVGAAMATGPSFDCGIVEAGSIEAMICTGIGNLFGLISSEGNRGTKAEQL